MKSTARPATPVFGLTTSTCTALGPTTALKRTVTSAAALVMCSLAGNPFVVSDVAATFGGANETIHAVNASTTTPHIASMPTARRSLTAS